VVLVTVHRTSGESGQGSDAAAPVFKAIMTEALRMLDVPKDIPEDTIAAKKPAKQQPGEFAGDVAIADLGGDSIMEEEDPAVRKLLSDQLKPAGAAGVPPNTALAKASPPKDNDEIPPAPPAEAAPNTTANPLVAEMRRPPTPTVPDFRGKSMRAVVEESLADGIDVTVEGSGVARAQLPLPGSPLRQGERIRIVFTR
jgi:cell division protein FtsI (penicillin-binding protein 3)